MSTIIVSNGGEFFEIPAADLTAAKQEGFYLPDERGMTIISNGQETFEIPMADLPQAEADGYKDLLVEQRRQLSSSANANGNGRTQRGTAVAAKPNVTRSRTGIVIDTHEAEDEALRVEREALLEELPGWKRPFRRMAFYLQDHRSAIQRNSLDYGVSMGLHIAVLLLLGLIIFETAKHEPDIELESAIEAEGEQTEQLEFDTELTDMQLEPTTVPTVAPSNVESEEVVEIDVSDMDPAANLELTMTVGLNISVAGDLAGRSRAGRRALAAQYGGNAASERAVAEGLSWLARHQLPDGSWSFNHTHVEGCDCQNAGSLPEDTRIAATGLALLTYLGAGHTFSEGSYSLQVTNGVKYLMSRVEITQGVADLRDGEDSNYRMYQHGIATIALCEALAMNTVVIQRTSPSVEIELSDGTTVTKEDLLVANRQLREAAQAAVNFIISSQTKPQGGWRYQPGTDGDTSVVGWQIMALKSANMAGLTVPNQTFSLAEQYLESVSLDDGAFYGYDRPQQSASTTAVGLLCRMYMGWRRERPALERGVAYLSMQGPDINNMYHNYYATQVIHHWGGEEWERWNAVMRDHLTQTQSFDGHQRGSWAPADPHGATAGRHYMTCLATMTLEVYYRHLPLYKDLE